MIEILSPGSAKKDRIIKKKVYERSKVPEFWIVDPSYRNVEIFQLIGERYEPVDFIEEGGTAKSNVLKGF